MKRASPGFTLSELVVVMVITIILTGILFQFGIGYTRHAASSQTDALAFVDRLNASDYFRENIGLSSGLAGDTAIEDAHVPSTAQSSVNSKIWRSIFPVKNQVLNSGNNVTPILYYKKYARNTSGQIIKNGNLQLEDYFVVYLDGPNRSVRVRTLANPTAMSLGSTTKTTCPVDAVTPTCKADLTLITDIKSVATKYFSRAGNIVDYTSIDDLGQSPCVATAPDYAGCAGAEFPSVEVVELTLNLSKVPFGADTKPTTASATIIRVALRNS